MQQNESLRVSFPGACTVTGFGILGSFRSRDSGGSALRPHLPVDTPQLAAMSFHCDMGVRLPDFSSRNALLHIAREPQSRDVKIGGSRIAKQQPGAKNLLVKINGHVQV